MHPEEKVLKAYYNNKTTSTYFNELKRHTGLSDSSLSRTLKKLTDKKILKKEVCTAVTNYLLTNTPTEFITFDKERFNALKRNVRYPLETFIKHLPKEINSTLIFGSASKNKHQEDSDIDILLIIDHYEDKKLQEQYEKYINQKLEAAKREANAQSNHPLSIFITTTKTIKEQDPLITQALSTGFPITGAQRYYEEIYKQ